MSIGPLVSTAAAATARRRLAPRVESRSRPWSSRLGLSAGIGLAAGLATSMAWWWPGTAVCAVLGWVASVLLVLALRAGGGLSAGLGCGLACNALGFYWVFGSIGAFTGFGPVVSAGLFGGFVALGTLQFVVLGFVYENLGPRWEALALRAPTALVVSELVTPRVFGWHFGHTQAAFTAFAQSAAIAGAMLGSFLMLWLAEALVRVVVGRERRRVFLLPVGLTALVLGYGTATERRLERQAGETLDVVLVQGNSALGDGFDPASIDRNIAQMHELSRQAARPGSLIVWPEGAIPVGVEAGVGRIENDPTLPFHGDGSAFIVGAYAHDGPTARFNSAFAVLPDGRVPRPYDKRVLIPFGEYNPMASVFPWINRVNPRADVFTPGTETTIFSVPMKRPDGTTRTVRAAPLICYEDTLPSLSRQAARKGADLLVNLTYDTWFGRSVAADEHHLIATFRAIENRRYLVRATNSGTSAVVDPLGRTVARIRPFVEGTATAPVRLIRERTLYTAHVGELPWWLLSAAAAGSIVVKGRRRSAPRD